MTVERVPQACKDGMIAALDVIQAYQFLWLDVLSAAITASDDASFGRAADRIIADAADSNDTNPDEFYRLSGECK